MRYYDGIQAQSDKMGIYAYELRPDSPAEKIFRADFKKDSFQVQIDNEKIALKEFILCLMNTRETSGFYRFLKSVKPLELDLALVQDYFVDICKGVIPQTLIDEIEYLYGEMDENIGNRLSCLEAIGNKRCFFEEEDDCDDELL